MKQIQDRGQGRVQGLKPFVSLSLSPSRGTCFALEGLDPPTPCDPIMTWQMCEGEGPSSRKSTSRRRYLRGGIIHSDDSGRFSGAMNPILLSVSCCLSLSISTAVRGPSLLNQWHLVCSLDQAPSDEPTSLGASAEGSLRRVIVSPTLVQSLHLGTAVSMDGGHSSPETFANK